MNLVLTVVCVAVLLHIAGCSAAAQDNLAPNPGFELRDGDAPAFGEKRTPDDPSRRMVWTDETARSGERSVGIITPERVQSRWRTGHLRDILLAPGSECRLSAWVKTEAVEGSAHLRLYFIDAGGGIVAQPGSRGLEGDNDWSLLELPFRVPEAPTHTMIYLEMNGTGSAWFDDVTLAGQRSEEALPGEAQATVYGPDDFWDLRGYEAVQRGPRRVIQLPPDVPTGEALLYFEGETARYDIIIQYLDEPDGASTVAVSLNDRELGARTFDEITEGTDDVLKEWTLPGVDVQRNSRLLLAGRAHEGEYARVVSVAFRAAGGFAGDLLPPGQLPPPPSLLVYRDRGEQAAARRMFAAFVSKHGAAPRAERRRAELAALQTPDDWRAYQRGVRARLDEFWGPFPDKTPLNPQVVGVIEHEQYSIEKVIFESRPGYFVTASFYRPKGREFPVPGVLVVCGHAADGKGYVLYHETCLGLVIKGYAVLAIDPTGQGERSEYFDPDTLANLVPLCVGQHHQLGRPSFLVGQTLGGYRTWDAIRGVDYLLTRTEVDPEKIAAVGNSGGGQMAFLVTAADERVAVCVAAHPGGSMENTYLTGTGISDREMLSLIPPRPCRVVVGRDSGENHGPKVDDMLQFYRGMGYGEERGELTWVDGVHDMRQPKRVAAYEWLNRWFGKEEEGSEEPPLEPLSAEDLWCTDTGFTLKSLGGETGQKLNHKRMLETLPGRPLPADPADADRQAAALRDAVTARLGLRVEAGREPPEARTVRIVEAEGFTAELLLMDSEPDITLPAVLLTPAAPRADAPVVIHCAERGKPTRFDRPSLPLELCLRGFTVLTLDVRNVGEMDPRGGNFRATVAGYNPDDWARDAQAINAHPDLGRTLAGMQAFDVIRAADWLRARLDLQGRAPVVVGEERGGLWALLAGAFDEGIGDVVTVRTLTSLKMLIENPYHEVRGYFWMPGALADFDLPELAALVAPRVVTWVDPVDAMADPVAQETFARYAAWAEAMSVARGGRVQVTHADADSLGETVAALAP